MTESEVVDREAADQGDVDVAPSLLRPKRIAQTAAGVVLLIAAIYILFPKIVGVQGTIGRLGDASPGWLLVALGMDVLAYASYVALFRGVIGGETLSLNWRESYQVTMAGLAAALLLSAGGAGGVILTYWALKKAGMAARQAACRMIAFLILLYTVYISAVLVNGVLLRVGVLHGPAPVGLTIVPAAIAGGLLVVLLLITLIPGDFERRFAHASPTGRVGHLLHRFATWPGTVARGARTALAFIRNPRRGGLAVIGAVGYWATNVGILWASFHGYGVSVPLGVVVQGFFVGLAANLFPFAPAGVGAVDAGMIGVFVIFGYPGADVFPAILTYRLFAFWLPIPPGVVAFFQLRRTVSRWDEGERPAQRVNPVTREPAAVL